MVVLSPALFAVASQIPPRPSAATGERALPP